MTEPYEDPQDSLRAELRRKFPGAAKAAKRSPSPAIRLFCIECMGGSKLEAEACESRDCFLWLHGARAQHEREPVEATPAQAAARARLAQAGAARFSAKRNVEHVGHLQKHGSPPKAPPLEGSGSTPGPLSPDPARDAG
jgi:hypothetical protein